MDAFDTDVLIYAVSRDHSLGNRVAALFSAVPPGQQVGVGSVLLFPELLAKPLRADNEDEIADLTNLLDRLDLLPVDRELAKKSTGLAAKYKLKAIDATHLATAALAGADRFITNNRKDFTKEITEVDVVYPEELPEVG